MLGTMEGSVLQVMNKDVSHRHWYRLSFGRTILFKSRWILDHCIFLKNLPVATFWALFLGIIVFSPQLGSANEQPEKSKEETVEAVAQWVVRGGGFLENRRLKNRLDQVFSERKEVFLASDIEDAVLVLISYLEAAGYLNCQVHAAIFDTHEATEAFEEVSWNASFDVFLSRNLVAERVEFLLEKGPRFFYNSETVTGEYTIGLEKIRSFFSEEPFFFQSERVKVFTRSGLQSGRRNLESHLRSLGYQETRVSVDVLAMDMILGAVDIGVHIVEGPRHSVKKIDILNGSDLPVLLDSLSAYEDRPYSRFWMQDITQIVRNRYYSEGYADVKVSVVKKELYRDGSEVGLEVNVAIEPGIRYLVSHVNIEGLNRTNEEWLKKRIPLKNEKIFNPLSLDLARLNISRTGVFGRVEHNLQRINDDHIGIEFRITERFPWKVDTLVGWGSYEQLRGGLTAERINLLGRAHRLRLSTLVSMKSRRAEARYLIPELLGRSTSLSSKTFYLYRDELAFDRLEYGVDLSISKKVVKWDLETDLVYTFQSLESRHSQLVEEASTRPATESARVGSVEWRLGRDRRNKPLNPTAGYRFYGRLEWASVWMGSEVDYQRFDGGLSWHGNWRRGLLWHLGVNHGVIGSLNKDGLQVPANKLFFPGGENSIRGYQRGGAAPRDHQGQFIGARSYLLLNLELEQRLTRNLSLIGFLDVLGTASKIEDYPLNETLSSIGLGIRYKTFMGPIRLEYGHNLNRRPNDPTGTLHFSLGYPF